MSNSVTFILLILVSCISLVGSAIATDCPVGDLYLDCKIDIQDLWLFAQQWLDISCSGPSCADLTGGDGVNIADFAVLAEHWGEVVYRLVINEFMADNKGTIEDPDEAGAYPDWIEIYNYGGTEVDIGGLYLSDDLAIPNMWQVPVGSPTETTIPAGGYLLIWADGQPLQGVLHVDFKLGASGEEVGLFDGNGNLIDGRTFGNQNADESYGRFPNGSATWQKFDGGTATPGSSNGGESVDTEIVISEIMYHPLHDELTYQPEPIAEEYIELLNRGVSTIDVGQWRFVNGIVFTIPADTTIESGGRLVVAADVSAFSTKYPGVSNVVGGWVGKLSNKSERIELVNVIGTVIDSVKYCDEGDWSERLLGPVDYNHRGWMWSDAHDGDGDSLELVCVTMPNEYGQNWKASTTGSGTPGVANSVDAVQCAPIILDVDHAPEMPHSTDVVSVTASIIDEAIAGVTVTLYWRIDTSVYVKSEYPTFNALSYNAIVMFDDGLHDDGQAGDGTYGGQIPAQSDGAIVEFFVEAVDSGANVRTWPAVVDVDSVKEQVANLLYQVDDSFAADTEWIPGKQPIYYIIMTEAERGRIEEIGAGDAYERFSDAQMNATFISVNGVDTKMRYNTGVRNRGEGTRRQPPNNYRVNFRHDDSWKSVTAININSKYTHLQLAGSAIFRMAGLSAAEGTAVQVRVNGENLALTDSNPSRMFGTYVHLEAIDSDFAANHFPTDGDGNIYKASIYPQVADLTYLGTDPALYAADGYSKGSNSSGNDWSDLFDLTNVLENEPDGTYLAELNRVVNTDQWIHWYAVQACIGNNETNLGNGYGDDYRIYAGITDPRFVLITHDMDTILGDGDNPSGIDDSIWRCIATHGSVQMAVIERFLQHPEYVWRYYAELQEVANTVFAAENIDHLLDEVLGGFVAMSKLDQLKQFVADRRANVLAQIPTAFTTASALPVVSGYYQTTSPNATVSGTANATETRVVRVNGQTATWDGVLGTWSFTTGDILQPGINRLVVQAYGDPNGLGDVLEKGYVDVWYNDGDESLISGTLATNTVFDAASGPWHVTGTIVVPASITLTIEPGATVFFNSSTGITVNGRLLAQGSEYARIRLTSVPGGSGWNGVAFSNTDEDNRMCYIDHGYGQGQGESVDVAASRLLIDNMTWIGTSNYIINMHNPKVTVTNSVVPGMTAESIHVQYVLNDEYLIMSNNIFEEGINGGDIVDIDTSGDGKIFVKFYDNIFYGGGDDGVDLDGTDTYLEGNIFMNFHKDTTRATTSNAIAAGEPYTGAPNRSDLWIVRNIFYDNDHAILLKEEAQATMINNVFIKSDFAAVQLWEEAGSAVDGPADGVDIVGCIFKDYGNIFNHQFYPGSGGYSDPVITVNNSMLPTDLHYLGTGNIDGDPLFVVDNIDFHLKDGSPAIGSGPNGGDMGRYVPEGAFVSGEPGPVTYRTDATLTVGGAGITDYMWRLRDNGVWAGGWSAEISVATPILLSGLANEHNYQVYVQGKNVAEDWVGPTDGNASRVWTVDPNYSQLRINEVLARNFMSVEHEGTYPDMIELYYDGPSLIDLDGYSLTDNIDLPTKFVFGAGTVLNPGEYLVVYADALATSGIHTGYQLTGSGDDVYLYDDGGVLVDSVVFGNQLEGMSFGRVGYDGNWTLTEVTFGLDNIAAALSDPADLKINEWLADGEILFGDDWIEIYNPGLRPVNMGGLYITDDPVGEPDKHTIRTLSFIAGEGFGVLKADASLAGGHVDFRLNADGEMIGLYDGGVEIDKVIFGPQMTDVSQGRAPNGGENLEFFGLPTPGVSNADANTVVTIIDLINIDDVWSYEQSGVNLSSVLFGMDDGSGSLVDDSYGFNDGTLMNMNIGTAWVPGHSGGGLMFDGINNYVEITDYKGVTGTQARTCSAWIKTTQSTTGEFMSWGTSGTGAKWAVGIKNNLFSVRVQGGNIFGSTPINDDVWHHVAVTWQPGIDNMLSNAKLYVDGNLETVSSMTDIEIDTADSEDVHIGNIQSTNQFQGLIDEVQIYSWALSVTDVNDVMSGGQGYANWYDTDYDDSGWSAGAGLLYVESSSLPAPKNTPLTLGENTYYFRKHFTFNGNPNEIDSLEFATVIDDGVIVYLNGFRVLSIRLEAAIQYSTFADPYIGNAVYEGFSIPADYLVSGDNVIAAEVHQSSPGSSDVVFGLELDTLTTTVNIENAYADSQAVLDGLRITEIMYNPAGDPNSEYIELINVSGAAINLDGVRFTNGIEFVFPAMTLDPDEYVIVVANIAMFENRYGTQINVAGEYLGRLSNGGETVVLKLADPLDAAVMRFEYKDGWYVGTDGGGYSLVINDPYGDPVSWQDSESWRESVVSGGSPGREDVATVIINEVLAHSHAAAPDWIELYNVSGSPVDIGGWYISDNADDLMKYRVADSTTINAGEYMVFYEDVTFGNPSDTGSFTQFGLSETGESVYVNSGQGGQLTGYTVEVDFGASENGVAFGRYVKSDDSVVFVSMDANTPGAINSDPKVGPVVISEIMYHPPVGGSYAAEEYEYIELLNTTGVSVTLDRFDAGLSVTVAWQFTDGIDYVFPLGTTIPAGGYLIVAKNPAAFAERYGSANGAIILGPFENDTKLSNGGEMVELSLPGDTDLLDVRHYVLVDSVRYDDEYPWPATPDGDGDSLDRINVATYGDDVINWQAEAVTPGI